MNKNFPYYILIALLFLLFKYIFTLTGTDDLSFLLKPTNALVSFATGSYSVYLPGSGYYHEKLNVIIDKSCSGYNFWLLCFVMLAFLGLKHFYKPIQKIILIPSTLIISYLLTILVNASRIFVSVVLHNPFNYFSSSDTYLILHQSVGIITNLVFLIIIYLLAEKILNKKTDNEKFT